MKLFTDSTHYSRERRPHLADILKPHFTQASPEDAEREYGPFTRQHPLCESIKESELCVLPMTWNYYYEAREMSRALEFIESARAAGRPVVSWNAGDFGVRVPVEDVYVIRACGYQSRRRPRHTVTPVFVPDPFTRLGLADTPLLPRSDKPRIGFCGQTDHSTLQGVQKKAWLLGFNAASALRLIPEEPQDTEPPTNLRMKALRILESSPLVDARFIKRDKHLGAPRSDADRKRLAREFFENIRDSDYTLCVRGRGNFSVRLYETLAMGRIPIFVDTDCILPFEDQIDWRRCCVWVDRRDLHRLPEKVAEFHAALDEDALHDLQRRCRALWLDRLTFFGFFNHFSELFPHAAVQR